MYCIVCKTTNGDMVGGETQADGYLKINYECSRCQNKFTTHMPAEAGGWIVEADVLSCGINNWDTLEEFDTETEALEYFNAIDTLPGVRYRIIHISHMRGGVGKVSF